MSYVYLASSETHPGLLKIGQSRQPQKRVREIGRGGKLLWCLECSDATNTERALHARYWRQRKHGEWFVLTTEDVEWITSRSEAAICDGFDQRSNGSWSRSFLGLCYWLERNGMG